MVLTPVPRAAHGHGIHSPGAPISPHLRSPNTNKHNRPINTLTTTLPGFTNPVSLPFPEKCLPVCIRCKKNYKTRELCRVRDGHTDRPWSLTYVCVTLDESCIDAQTGRIIDGPFEAMSLDFHQPVCEKEKVPSTTPICASCKEKNYTRAYCREKQLHNQLPWSTVYCRLTRAHNGAPASPVPESPGAGSVRSREDRGDKDDSGCRSPKKQKTVEGSVANSPTCVAKDDDTSNGESESEPLYPVPQSRTFLLEVDGKKTILRWLDIDPKHVKEPPKATLYKVKIDDRTAHYSPGHAVTSPGASPWGAASAPGSCPPSGYGAHGYGHFPPHGHPGHPAAHGAYGHPGHYPPASPFSPGSPPGYSHGGPHGSHGHQPSHFAPPPLPPPSSQWSHRQDIPSLPPYRSQAPHPSYYQQPEQGMPGIPPAPQVEYRPPTQGEPGAQGEKHSFAEDAFGPPLHLPPPVPSASSDVPRQTPGDVPTTPPSSKSHQHTVSVSETDKTSPEYAGFEPPPSVISGSDSRTTAEPLSPGHLYALTEVVSWQHGGTPSWLSHIGNGSLPGNDTWAEPLDFTKSNGGEDSLPPVDFALAKATSSMGLSNAEPGSSV